MPPGGDELARMIPISGATGAVRNFFGRWRSGQTAPKCRRFVGICSG